MSFLFIKKNYFVGLGFDKKSDPWIAHNDDFNTILQNLQAAHGVVPVKKEETNKNDAPSTTGLGFQTSSSSTVNKDDDDRLGLESKSKSSRSRIQYVAHTYNEKKD